MLKTTLLGVEVVTDGRRPKLATFRINRGFENEVREALKVQKNYLKGRDARIFLFNIQFSFTRRQDDTKLVFLRSKDIISTAVAKNQPVRTDVCKYCTCTAMVQISSASPLAIWFPTKQNVPRIRMALFKESA